jgi:hypothetical protein
VASVPFWLAPVPTKMGSCRKAEYQRERPSGSTGQEARAPTPGAPATRKISNHAPILAGDMLFPLRRKLGTDVAAGGGPTERANYSNKAQMLTVAARAAGSNT